MRGAVEKRITRVYWNDGLLDTLAGLAVIGIGVAWLTDLVPLGAVLPASLVPLWKPLRAKITEPRLGYVDFSEPQHARDKKFLVGTIAAGVLVFALVITMIYFGVGRQEKTEFHRMAAPALPLLILAIMSLMATAATALNRFIVYAVVLVAAGCGVAILNLDPGWGILAGGIVMCLAGLVVVAQFIKRHPLVDDGVTG